MATRDELFYAASVRALQSTAMLYKAFISYSHVEDAKLAEALESALRRFAKPRYWHRGHRVFRDKSNLSLTHALWTAIEEALAASEYLVLLASPTAAHSPWVQREVTWWLEHRSSRTLLIVLTDGALEWSETARRFNVHVEGSSLPPVLEQAFEQQPLWLDLRWARSDTDLTLANSKFHQGVAEIAARLHGRHKDELVGDDVREYQRARRHARNAVIALTLLAVTAGASAWIAWRQSQQAERERQEAVRQATIARENEEIARAQTKIAEDQTDRAKREAGIALARQLVAQAEIAWTSSAADRQVSALLAIEALRRFQILGLRSFEADVAVRQAFSLLPQTVVQWRTGWPVHAAAFDRSGQKVVAASQSLGSRTWNVRTRMQVADVKPRGADLQSIAVAPGGKFLAAGTTSGEAYVLDALSLEPVSPRASLGEDQFTLTVAVSADGALLAMAGRSSPDATLTVVHAAMGTTIGSVPFATDVAFSPSNRYLAAGGGLWEVTETTTGHSLKATALPAASSFDVDALAFSPDEQFFARAISNQGTRRVELWSLPSMRQLDDFSYDVTAMGLAVSAGGRYVALAGSYFVELREPATESSVVVQHGSPTALAFSPVEPTLAVGDAGGTLTVWTISSLFEAARFRPPGDVKGVSFGDDGRRVITLSWVQADRVGTAMLKRMWDARSGREDRRGRQTLAPHAYAFSADETTLAVADRGVVSVSDAATGRLRRRIGFSGLVARQVALSGNGQSVAVLTDDRLWVWDVASGKEIATLSCAPQRDEFIFYGTEPRIALGEQGWYLASAFRRRLGKPGVQDKLLSFVRVWDIRASTDLFTTPISEPVFGKPSSPISFSPDGRHFAVGRDDGEVTLYAPERGGAESSRFPYGLVGFSANSRYLVTSGTDVESPTFRAYSASDLRYFATGTAADVAHVWDLSNGQEVARIRHEPGSRPISISRDGSYLALLGKDGSVRVSPTHPEALLVEACDRLVRDLSTEEWKRYIGDEPQQSACRKAATPQRVTASTSRR